MRQLVRKCSTWVRVKHQFGVSETVPVPSFIAAPRTVEINGCPFTFGQPMAGADVGPQKIRDAGLRAVLSDLGWSIQDHGNMEMPVASHDDASAVMKNQSAVGEINKLVMDKIYNATSGGAFHLLLGGDHSIGCGAIAGILKARPDTGIVWVDAHSDINTPACSPSGNAHGMPVALNIPSLNPEPASMAGLEWLTPSLSPDQIVYIGLRDVDKHERKIIQDLGIAAYTMHDIDRHGIGLVMQEALSKLEGRPLHMSYDIDAVDPGDAPATGTVVRGGLTFREALYVAESVAMTGQLGSMDMVEVNPSLSDDEGAAVTAELALKIIGAAMGSTIL